MPRPTGTTLLLIGSLALVAGGCFKLARTSPPVERYVLGGAQLTRADSTPGTANGLAIGLRRLDLAPYLSTLAIVVRRADNEIVTTGFHRWAESPSAGLNRAVSGYLALAQGIRSVDVAPWPVRSEHDYIVQLHVLRFEGVTTATGAGEGSAQFLARWEIIHPSDGALAARGATDFRASDWAIDDYAGLVTRLDRGLVELAQDLVACLGRLGPAAAAATAADSTAVVRAPTLDCAAR